MTGKFIQHRPESAETFGGGVFVAEVHFDAEADAEIRHEITVIDVTGSTGF